MGLRGLGLPIRHPRTVASYNTPVSLWFPIVGFGLVLLDAVHVQTYKPFALATSVLHGCASRSFHRCGQFALLTIGMRMPTGAAGQRALGSCCSCCSCGCSCICSYSCPARGCISVCCRRPLNSWRATQKRAAGSVGVARALPATAIDDAYMRGRPFLGDEGPLWEMHLQDMDDAVGGRA